jgi:hypothetical protein
MLAWLASLAYAGHNAPLAEAYFTQLLSWCVFSQREIGAVDD